MDEDLIRLEGFDDAILGVATRGGAQDFYVYSRAVCIELLMTQNDWDFEEAAEYFDFNVQGAWFGDTTPAFME